MKIAIPITMLVILFIAVAALIVVVPAYMEARTYNKLTGANVTTWDAIWIDLRVISEPRK